MQSVPNTTDVVSSNLDQARCTTLCDKLCQWLATAWWFSLGPPVSSTNKTDCHDITEILLKVVLTPSNKQTNIHNKRQRNPKGQSRMDNPEKLATLGTQDTERRQTKQKTKHICWTPLYTNKHNKTHTRTRQTIQL
jgi:hypothetical protein